MLYDSLGVIAVAFIAGGIVMLVVERHRPDADGRATPSGRRWPRAFGIGLCQMLALVPGVSRSGATIVGGMVARARSPAAAEFSFFLAMPTMAAAFVARSARGADRRSRPTAALEIAIGFVMAFVASLLVDQAVPGVREALRLRALRVVSHRASALAFSAAIARGLAVA